MRFAFISRHPATKEQTEICAKNGIEIEHVGDFDGFTVTVNQIDEHGRFDGVICAHVGMAMRLAPSFLIGTFENGNRAAIGEKPDFFAKNLHIWDLRD